MLSELIYRTAQTTGGRAAHITYSCLHPEHVAKGSNKHGEGKRPLLNQRGKSPSSDGARSIKRAKQAARK
ncbi:hypothetical protein EYF80_034218 [Liparis tanakae]|uniref:Uncharacterized protein n=1 Tax=Liparis tanakae TaxID=230148 RepID=A0A4Z2GQP4_9TELE|nr:hypothetical protein EYF80_034218 [Liparis tanakae]